MPVKVIEKNESYFMSNTPIL